MAAKERFETKLEIIKLALHVFLTYGYKEASTKKIAKELGISVGNLTYHFPTKEHLLTELTERLCEYHLKVMESEIDEGLTSLLVYLMELTCMMAVCDESEIAKDLYTSMYRSPMALKMIRESDTRKVMRIFAQYCPGWELEDFALTENAVSGIEYASLMTQNAENIPLDKRIEKTLNVVMKAYNVPEEVRELKLKKVLAMDYRRIGRQFIAGFSEYVESINKQALEEAYDKL